MGRTHADDYEDLIKALIENDTHCPSPTCQVTMLGHLLAGLPEEQVELVKALDTTDGVVRR